MRDELEYKKVIGKAFIPVAVDRLRDLREYLKYKAY